MDYMRLADKSWPVLRRLMTLHTVAYRATGGRIGHRVPGAPPMLLLDHVGAKSGVKRTTPLVYVDDVVDGDGDRTLLSTAWLLTQSAQVRESYVRDVVQPQLRAKAKP